MYLLTLFLKTCLVAPPEFAMSSDLVLLSLSSKAPFVTILLRVETRTGGDLWGDVDADGDLDESGDFGFLMGFWIWRWRIPLPLGPFLSPMFWALLLIPFLILLILLSSSLFQIDEEEFEELPDFSLVSSLWLKHQLQVPRDSGFGYRLLQYLPNLRKKRGLILKQSNYEPYPNEKLVHHTKGSNL